MSTLNTLPAGDRRGPRSHTHSIGWTSTDGSSPTAFTEGAIGFGDSGSLAQDPRLVWDNTEKILKVGAGFTAFGIASIAGGGLPLRLERVDAFTTAAVGGLEIMHTTPGSMGNGFGIDLRFLVRDAATAIDNVLARIVATRVGANNTGSLAFQVANAGTLMTRLAIEASGTLVITKDTGGSATPGFTQLASGLFIDVSNYTTNDAAGLTMRVRQDTSVAALRQKTGIWIDAYNPPDNGGEASGIFAFQVGGGNAASFFKISSSSGGTPDAKTAYPLNGWALEVGTSDGTAAAIFHVGSFGSTNAANAINVTLNNSVSKGIIVVPGGGVTFDTRPAYEVGNMDAGVAANAAIQFQVRMNGDTWIGRGLSVMAGGSPAASLGGGTVNTQFSYFVNGTQVLAARITGWGAPTNTKARTTFDTTTVSLPDLAARVGALIDDLMTHGLINV